MTAAARARRAGAWTTVVVAVVGLSAGCVDEVLVPAGPRDDPVVDFDQLWTEADRHYAFFEEKGIDWDGVYQEFRPQVTDNMTDRDLFRVLSDVLDRLEDGHGALWTPVGHYSYWELHNDHPENFVWTVAKAQLVPPIRVSQSGQIIYGHLTADIGYIYVPAFEPYWAGDMDAVLDDLSDVKALVVDVRNNGGGSTNALPAIIGRFVDERRVYQRHQFRDGPAHDQFSHMFESVVEPRGERFKRPVAVLTNRNCYSTTEDFILATRVLPSVFTVGDTTGGAQGNPISRELPNGWVFRISRWRAFFPDGSPLPEGVGLPPDYPVQMTQDDIDRGVDTIIARAMELLQERLAGP